jgi:hypothetical protein
MLPGTRALTGVGARRVEDPEEASAAGGAGEDSDRRVLDPPRSHALRQLPVAPGRSSGGGSRRKAA